MKKRPGMTKLQKREALQGYLFIMPWIIGFLVFVLFALIYALWISMTDWDMLTTPNYVGTSNYVNLFGDDLFLQSLKVTLVYSFISVPLNIAVGLTIALLLNQKIKFLGFWRTLYYFPSVISGVSVYIMWLWAFNPDFGIINYLLSLVGVRGPGWILSETWALPSIMLTSIWAAGGGMVIYLAGLQGVPTELYESASIDGANSWSQFWSITIPMISPVLFYNLIIGLIASFQTFMQPFVMTNGGPNNSTLFYGLYLYKNAFKYFKMGYSSAMGWILFVIVLFITLLLFGSSRRWVFYSNTEEDKS